MWWHYSLESGFRKVVVLARKDVLEGLDGLGQRNKLALNTCENFGNSEGLAHETLNLSGTLNGCRSPSATFWASMVQMWHTELVLFTQLIHTKNGNDILEALVALENELGLGGNVVVFLSDNT